MIGMAGAAVFAHATTLSERNDDASAGLERLDVLADLFNHAGEFVSEDGWQPRLETDPAPIALPEVPVRAADAAALDAHDRAIGRAFRLRPIILDHHGLADFFEYQSFHELHTSFRYWVKNGIRTLSLQ